MTWSMVRVAHGKRNADSRLFPLIVFYSRRSVRISVPRLCEQVFLTGLRIIEIKCVSVRVSVPRRRSYLSIADR